MGIRGEIFTKSVQLPNRTYFFNVKENRMGDIYLNIVESKNRESGGFDRQSVILFADDLQEFLKGFDESLRVLEKTVRGKKRTVKNESGEQGGRSDRGDKARDEKKMAYKSNHDSGPRKREGKRIVVKKSADSHTRDNKPRRDT